MTLLSLDWGLLGEKLTLVVIIVSVSLVIAMYETYAERKIAAFIQDRLGPNRAGPFGILQPLADGLKLFMKEEKSFAEKVRTCAGVEIMPIGV